MRAIGIFKMVTLGWPCYLLFDAAGPPTHAGDIWTSHFNPFCKLFRASRQKFFVFCSDVALAAWIYVLVRLTNTFGIAPMVKFYFIPYLIVNFWLVTITFLQHTDPEVPRYNGDEWNWLRGALGTVDRDFGIFNVLHHHIADTHVIHHLFSKMPHYHAQEATAALRQSGLLDNYWLEDCTPWYMALWRSYRDCWFVDENPVAWFRSCKEKHV
jgi:omega-6 fatty acid desaturase (delta-12 desaturase)